MRPLIAGNWKMNGMARQLGELETIAALVKAAPPFADVLICPPATLIASAVQTAAGRITIGGQNCHKEIREASTEGISADMLRHAGASAEKKGGILLILTPRRIVPAWEPFVRLVHWRHALNFAVAWFAPTTAARIMRNLGYD